MWPTLIGVTSAGDGRSAGGQMQGLLGGLAVVAVGEGNDGDGGVQRDGGPLLRKGAVVLRSSRATRKGVPS